MSSTHEAIIEQIKEWRLREGLSNHTIIKRIKEMYGYAQSTAYTLIKTANIKIAEQYKETNADVLETRIEELENMYEEARQAKQHKLAFQIKQEISKLQGLHTERVELKQTVIQVKVQEDPRDADKG